MYNKQALLRVVNQPEERLLLAKVLDQADLSLKKHEKYFSDFIDPKKTNIINNILNKITDLNTCVFGGNEECERKMFGFSPVYSEIELHDFPIKALKITSNLKFAEKMSHRDYLGSILGLGIDRGKIGDIVLFENYTLCYVNNDIADYISLNLTKVSRTKVSTSILDLEEVVIPDKNVVEKVSTVASLRLDAVVSTAFHLSRGKALALIESEKVFVNWSVVSNGSAQLKEGDMVSVRGLGRVKLSEIRGKTKKDRISIVICTYI